MYHSHYATKPPDHTSLRLGGNITYIFSILREVNNTPIYCPYLESWLGIGSGVDQVVESMVSILREFLGLVLPICCF